MIIALRMRNNRANNNSFMYKTKDIKKLLQIINFLIETNEDLDNMKLIITVTKDKETEPSD